jgi:hypothetical protein
MALPPAWRICGMGLERLTVTLLGPGKHSRETSLFPSDPKRIAGHRLRAKIFFGGENIRNEMIRLLKDNDMNISTFAMSTPDIRRFGRK